MRLIRWGPLMPRHFWHWPSLGDEEDWLAELNQGLSVYETNKEIVVKANIAGVPADKVEVTIEGRVVRIKAKHKESDEERKKKKVIHREAKEARYIYTTTLPCAVKGEQAKAEVKDGMLRLSLPKKKQVKAKRVVVKAREK